MYKQNFGGEKLKAILAYYKIYFLQWGRNLQKYLSAKSFPLQLVPISQLNSSQMNNCLWQFLVINFSESHEFWISLEMQDFAKVLEDFF